MLEKIKSETRAAVRELLEKANLREHDILVVGCSSSEIGSFHIGSHSSAEIGQAVFEVFQEEITEGGIYLAAQCCEHLNRALILEEAAACHYGYEVVNVVPHLKAGGSFGTAAYGGFRRPVAVEYVKAAAGIDIGDTLIGMHLKAVAVPVRISVKTIGGAHVVCARTRARFIGGERAHYHEELM